MPRIAIAATAVLAALLAAPAVPCTVPAAPRMLVPSNGAADVTWRRPILLVAVPASDGGTLALREVLSDGGLQPVSASVSRVTYPSPVEGRMTVLPSAPLTPDASYALSWVQPPSADVPLGTFATGPATTFPNPFPFTATRFPYQTRGDAGTCVDSCAVYGFGSNSLAWNTDAGQTFLWISDPGSGATVAYGVMPYDRAWYVCHPDAQAGGLISGFTVVSDGGSRGFDLAFLNPSGIVAVTTTQTFDLSCTEFDPGPQCRPPDAGSDAGSDAGTNQDAGQDGGDTTPPPGSCGCGATGGGAALVALLALAAALRAGAGASRRRSGS